MGQFDGAVERGLDGRQVGGDRACPGDGDAREGFGDEEAVPGAELPGTVGMNVTGVDGGVDELCQLGDAGLGHHGRAPGAVGGDGTVVSGEIGSLEIAEAGGAIAGTGTADGEEAHVLCRAGDELAVEALADEKGEAVVAEGPYAGEKAAVPESVHGGSGDVEADGGSGFADVLVAESGSETQGDDTRDPRNDCEYDSLLKGVGGGHRLSLPLRWAAEALCKMLGISFQFAGFQLSKGRRMRGFFAALRMTSNSNSNSSSKSRSLRDDNERNKGNSKRNSSCNCNSNGNGNGKSDKEN